MLFAYTEVKTPASITWPLRGKSLSDEGIPAMPTHIYKTAKTPPIFAQEQHYVITGFENTG